MKLVCVGVGGEGGFCMCDGWVYEFITQTVVWVTYDMRVQFFHFSPSTFLGWFFFDIFYFTFYQYTQPGFCSTNSEFFFIFLSYAFFFWAHETRKQNYYDFFLHIFSGVFLCCFFVVVVYTFFLIINEGNVNGWNVC